jgi:hypothetical protein
LGQNTLKILVGKKFFIFYRSRKFVTVFTKASHWSLWRARRKQCIHHTPFLHLCLISIPRSSKFPLLFSFYDSNSVRIFSHLPMRATSPAQLTILYFVALIA